MHRHAEAAKQALQASGAVKQRLEMLKAIKALEASITQVGAGLQEQQALMQREQEVIQVR